VTLPAVKIWNMVSLIYPVEKKNFLGRFYWANILCTYVVVKLVGHAVHGSWKASKMYLTAYGALEAFLCLHVWLHVDKIFFGLKQTCQMVYVHTYLRTENPNLGTYLHMYTLEGHAMENI
jgi:hypothetical protein